MPTANVLRLDDYRDRRSRRLTLSRALHQRDRGRAALFGYLEEMADLTGADRVAVVWVDEYGPGLVHPHLVVDLIADRANRVFSIEPLHRAWDCGIPGAYDEAADRDARGANTVAIALGSDGSRGWFVVAESLARRARLEHSVRDRLMFLAGECSAVVLHRDLDIVAGADAEQSFAGWSILRDLEGHDDDEERSQIVARRFAVGRLAHMLLDEDLCVPDDNREEQVRRARHELTESPTDWGDLALMEAVLRGYESGGHVDLAAALLALGLEAERRDHVHGALDLYQCAYDVAVMVAEPATAIDAARFSGRVLRRRAEWRLADSWYTTALELSRAAGLQGKVALSLNGLGLIARERGNLPAARATFDEALLVAKGAGEPDAIGAVYHDFMGLEHLAGNLHDALRHGWHAVNSYTDEVGKTRCTAGMAGVLKELGDWQAAEDAYTIVAHRSTEHYYLIYALDALAHIAALRGQADVFDQRVAQLDEFDWESGPLSAKAEILYYRGVGTQALGRTEEARSWLGRAVDFAAEHEFGQVLFKAETALASLGTSVSADPIDEPRPAPPEVRAGLRAMREELVGSAN